MQGLRPGTLGRLLPPAPAGADRTAPGRKEAGQETHQAKGKEAMSKRKLKAKPGDVLEGGAIAVDGGRCLLYGVVMIHKSRLRRAIRLGWARSGAADTAEAEKHGLVTIERLP